MENEQHPSSTTDRKTVERNRRNHLKSLYSKLNSLISSHNSTEVLPLHEQLEEAINYIKMLEKKLESLKEKKEQLIRIERSSRSMSRSMMVELKTPHIEIHAMGSALEVILISGLDSEFMFYEIIRLLQEEGADVVSANFSVINQAYFHTIHSEVGESPLDSGAARISNRLKKFVHEYFTLSERMAPQSVQQSSASVDPLFN